MTMNKKITNILAFAVGAAIGSAVTWKVLKTKYDKIVQEEIDSVKEIFSTNFIDSQETDDEDMEQPEDEPDERNIITTRQINWADYEDLDVDDDEFDEDPDYLSAKYADIIEDYIDTKGGVAMGSKPYVISPYDYGTLDDYHQIELTYYADDILEDSDGEIVTDAEEIIGDYALRSFGDYEPDSVHVRNDMLRTDFEILRDPRTYDQARSIGPRRVDDE